MEQACRYIAHMAKQPRKRGLTMAERLLVVAEGVPAEALNHTALMPCIGQTARRRGATGNLVELKRHPRATHALELAPGREAQTALDHGVWYYWANAQVKFDDTSGTIRGKTPDERANTSGRGALTTLLDERELTDVTRWTSINRPGWTLGGDLAITCPHCDGRLRWFDWWHSDAVSRRNTYVIACATHGVVNKSLPPSRRELINARRVLDSRLWAAKKMDSSKHIYAFDVLGLGPKSVYVGQTGKTVDERMEEHRAGVRPVHVIKKGGEVGPLRRDLPHLPALPTIRTALAAERWVAAHYEYRGFTVYGDGRA